MTKLTQKIVLLAVLGLAGVAIVAGWGLIPKQGDGNALEANGTIEATEVEVSSKLPGC